MEGNQSKPKLHSSQLYDNRFASLVQNVVHAQKEDSDDPPPHGKTSFTNQLYDTRFASLIRKAKNDGKVMMSDSKNDSQNVTRNSAEMDEDPDIVEDVDEYDSNDETFSFNVNRSFSNSGSTGFSAGLGAPIKVTFEDISAAASRISENEGIRRTPCSKSVNMSNLLDMDVFLKRDYMQVTGSFKERGARNTLLMLSEKEKRKGVITASAGNHGLALAYHGNELNIPVTVCMPVNAPIMKVQQCKLYRANVHSIGADIIEAKAHAMILADAKDLCYINGYDHPYIIAGQGTCGIEIHEQVQHIDAVVVPIGGGGLIAGCAIALKHLNPNLELIGVESDQSASFKAASDAGVPVSIDVNQSMTLADGLCVSKVGFNAFSNARHLIDRLVQVDEASIALSVLRLVEEEKCVVEGAGATGLAAAVAGLLDDLKGKRVVFILCGGNIDTNVLGRVLDRGLAADGRLVKFTVVVSDRPGGLSDLVSYISSKGAGIKDIFSERAWLKTSIHTVRNKVVIEVRDFHHGQEIRNGLAKMYENLVWGNEPVMCGSVKSLKTMTR